MKINGKTVVGDKFAFIAFFNGDPPVIWVLEDKKDAEEAERGMIHSLPIDRLEKFYRDRHGTNIANWKGTICYAHSKDGKEAAFED